MSTRAARSRLAPRLPRSSATPAVPIGPGRRAALAASLTLVLLGVAVVAEAACSVTQGDFDGNGSTDLRVVGDGRNQTLTVYDDPTAGTTTVFFDCDGDGGFTNAAAGDLNGLVFGEFELFDIRMGNGSDDVIIVVPNASWYRGKNRNFVVQLGGNVANTFRFFHDSTAPFELTAEQSRLTIDVQAGGGPDLIEVLLKGARASQIVVRVDAGGGDDQIRFGTTEEVRFDEASVVDVSIDADTGNDRVIYNPSPDLHGGSVYRVSIATGAGADTVEGGLGALVNDGQLHLTVDLGTGNDVLSWTPPLLVRAAGQAHIGIIGGTGNDNIKIDGAGALATCIVEGLLALNVHGDDGNDGITANLSPPTACEVDGTVRVHLDGDSGNDAVSLGYVSNAASTGKYDFLVRGGLGADTLLLAFDNAGVGTAAAYTPVGAALLDGGYGTDECIVAGAPTPLAHLVNCE
jgi:hypothetical protein